MRKMTQACECRQRRGSGRDLRSLPVDGILATNSWFVLVWYALLFPSWQPMSPYKNFDSLCSIISHDLVAEDATFTPKQECLVCVGGQQMARRCTPFNPRSLTLPSSFPPSPFAARDGPRCGRAFGGRGPSRAGPGDGDCPPPLGEVGQGRARGGGVDGGFSSPGKAIGSETGALAMGSPSEGMAIFAIFVANFCQHSNG